MLACILIVLLGTAVTYFSLTSMDCNDCWHRDGGRTRNARVGVGITVVGCLLVCYQFWYWC